MDKMGALPSHIGNEDNAGQSSSSEPWNSPVFKFPTTSQDEDEDSSKEEKQEFSDKLSRERKLKIFQKKLLEKRKLRHEIIAKKSDEMNKLRKLVNDLTNKVEVLENENQQLRMGNATQVETKREDVNNSEENASKMAQTMEMLENANEELQLVTEERDALKSQIEGYRKVTKCTKDMLQIRDEQLAQLKAKLALIESSVANFEQESTVATIEHECLTNLKSEYEKQLENMRELKILYEKRSKVFAYKEIKFDTKMAEYKVLLEDQTVRSLELTKKVEDLTKELAEKESTLTDLGSQLESSKAEARHYQQELSVINKLFSQTLLGASKKDAMDIDQLAVLLEQNHDLLRDMAVNETEEMSAMPRTLLDLINQVQKSTENRTESCSDSEVSQSNTENLPANDDESCAGDNTDMSSESSESDTLTVNSAEEIVSKLQTVWRVLRELLSHQSECPKTQDVPEVEQNDGMVPKNRGSACYKSIQTPTGPRLVLSVSKTYIRLKDLIIEKKALQRELARLKQLNSHLEARFGSQQRRLGNVSSELSQTWCLAGRMQKSYKTLHSHEQILRYELQQKRKMLNELKQELQLCREKWQQAKEKNCESEVEWKRLRSEFASRKKLDLADGCGSAESGYSDERSDESDCETKNLANDCTDNLDNDVEHVGSSNDIVEEDEHVLSHNNDVVEDEIVNVINSIEIEELSGNDINEIDGVEVEDETDIHINKENSCKSDFNTTQIGDGSNNVTVVDNPDKEGADSTLELEAQSCSSSGSFNKISNIDNDEKSQNLDKLNTCKDDKVDACSEPSTSSSFNVSLLNQPVASNSQTNPTTTRPEQTAAEKLLARDERLRKMEEQCKQLVNKVTKTSHRSKELCCRLEELHEQYGRDDQTRGETECEPAVTKEKEHSEDEE